MQSKAASAGRLSPVKLDNAAMRNKTQYMLKFFVDTQYQFPIRSD